VPTGPSVPASAIPQQMTPADNASVLTEAERRVAELVSLGRTNREVAKTLWITVSTVEQHLTRVYRKLNINGRGDLLTCLGPDRARSA
jgi:DNA-binding CsgD family transcriptional regulator